MEVEPSTWYSSRDTHSSIDPAHWRLTSQPCLCSNHHSNRAQNVNSKVHYRIIVFKICISPSNLGIIRPQLTTLTLPLLVNICSVEIWWIPLMLMPWPPSHKRHPQAWYCQFNTNGVMSSAFKFREIVQNEFMIMCLQNNSAHVGLFLTFCFQCGSPCQGGM